MSTLQINKTKYKQFKVAAIGSSAALVLGGLIFFQPLSLADNSYADTTDIASLDMSVNLAPTITIWTTDTNNHDSNQVNISADPDESVSTGSIRTHVSTNNLTGYTLTIQSNSSNAKMAHEDSNVTATINPITGNGTSTASWTANSDLNNMWGYSIGNNDSYVGVSGSSASAVTIDSTSAPNTDNSTDITFAAKADMSLPAGTYTDTVVFSATANYVQPTTMQKFTTSDCARLETWSSSADDITLRDTRDNNTYTIRKLKDDKCWMTDNLRLGGSSAMNLTGATTNLANESDAFTLPAFNTSGEGDRNTPYIYENPGTDYGVLYNWAAATAIAENATSYKNNGENVSTSICPKNWRLPSGGGAAGSDWYDMFAAYGYASGTTASNLTSAPLSLVWSGLWNGSLKDQGDRGYWWSSTVDYGNAADDARAYGDGYVVPGNDDGNKDLGFAVRCVLSSS